MDAMIQDLTLEIVAQHVDILDKLSNHFVHYPHGDELLQGLA